MKAKLLFISVFLQFLFAASVSGQKYQNGTRLLKGAEVMSATPLQLDYVLEKLADTAKITVNLHEGKTHLVPDDGSGNRREWWYYMGNRQVKGNTGGGPGIPGNNSWNVGGNLVGGKMGTISAGRVDFITDNKKRMAVTPSGDIKLMNPSVRSNRRQTPADNYLAANNDSVLTAHDIYSLNELLHERVDIATGDFKDEGQRINLPFGDNFADSSRFFAVKIMFECHSRDLKHYMLGEAWLYNISSKINIPPAVEYKIVASAVPDVFKNSVRFFGLYRNRQDPILGEDNTLYFVLKFNNPFYRPPDDTKLVFRATVVDMIRKTNPNGISGRYTWEWVDW